MNYDFLIIGHGLAGAILAVTLREQGHRVLVIDSFKPNAASRVAAGLVNPLAGKRYAKSWNIDAFLPFANDFYKTLEKRFNVTLFHHKPILKLFSSIEEQNTWMAKSAGGALEAYVAETYLELPPSEQINQEMGGICIKGGGYVDLKKMLDPLAAELQQQNCFRNEPFRIEELIVTEQEVRYKDVTARHVVFCEGYQAIHNPYFKWLPFSPNKGEVLDVSCDNFTAECIYNKAVYVVPLGDNQHRIGATYNWREVNEELTDTAREELTGKFQQIFKVPYRVTAHMAGIRPAVRDRKPLIGTHPHYQNISIFNGMGSKGVLMAPYLAQNFADALAGKGEIIPEANINRYISLY
ncbi:MAG: FAD-binding oxidoreductase [Hymenobacteraceae bacterium]|nr:FAD-binding oxidoreductase [Hymenobacteraceae bacterium]MDX5396531.1 FAD-binding oxidoreductase [Hymenobacteraceae bacterium]MDX5512595.1 FAD-binding oxidoreductase [Hymenobacteraceae bacterium]